MGLRTGAEYRKSLKKMSPVVYYRGEKVDDVTTHPLIKYAVDVIAQIYDWTLDKRYDGVLTTISPLTGDRIDRFMHVFGSIDDLTARQRQIRLLMRKMGTCTLKCTGLGGVNALYSTTYDIDKKCGTDYHKRFKEWLSHLHKEGLWATGCMMDAKGDRHLPASEQADPDMYLRVVKEMPDGVVVRGCKAHQTAPFIADEVVIMPCDVMRSEQDKPYAIAFTLPANAQGIKYIHQYNLSDAYILDADRMDLGNARYGCQFGTAALMIFDDVFVPKERIFMHGEWEFTRQLVSRMGTMARLWQTGCRPGIFDLLTGGARLIAQANGVLNTAHIRDKLTEMSYLTETVWGLALGAASCSTPTPSGAYLPNPLLTNIAKLQSTRAWYELIKTAVDISGGLVTTVPSEKDLRHPEMGKFVEKYLRGAAEIPAEQRMRVAKFIQALALSPVSAALHHSGGPMENQKIIIGRETDWEAKEKAVKLLTEIEDGEVVDLGRTPFPGA